MPDTAYIFNFWFGCEKAKKKLFPYHVQFLTHGCACPSALQSDVK